MLGWVQKGVLLDLVSEVFAQPCCCQFDFHLDQANGAVVFRFPGVPFFIKETHPGG